MSEVAGRLAPQVGAWTLQKANGGRGVLMGGVPGVAPAKVAVIGGGVVGTHAARVAAGMGADVTVLDTVAAAAALPRRRLRRACSGPATPRGATTEEAVAEADMVIGAVLIPGAAAPKLVSRAQLATDEAGRGDRRRGDRPGRLLRDLAADDARRPDLRGRRRSCTTAWRTCRARWRAPRRIALGNATLPFLLALADKGWRRACEDDPHLLAGLNTHAGHLTYAAVGGRSASTCSRRGWR